MSVKTVAKNQNKGVKQPTNEQLKNTKGTKGGKK